MSADDPRQDLIRRLLSHFPGMAYQCAADLHRSIRFASDGARVLTGIGSAELTAGNGRPLRGIIDPEDRAAVDRAVEEALQSGNGFSIRYRLLREEGRTLWVWDRGSVVEENGTRRIEGWLTDITELVYMEMRAAASQRREALGELIGGVAGEYNNVLTSVIGGIDLALQRFTPDDPLSATLEDGRAAAIRGGNLTRQLLAFARQFPASPKVTDLNALLHRTQGLFHQLLGREIRLLHTLDPELPPVRVDPAQMEQVILNLVLNARDAMPDGGRIVIRSEGRTLTAGDLRKGDELPVGPYAAIHITDSGHGVDQEVRDRMFEPFVTTKPDASGLGLATAYGIVQQAGGVIRVRSRPGEGATFSILLPAFRVETTAPIAEEGEGPVAIPLILVVDDEDGVRRTMIRALERAGFHTVEASDTPSALRRMEGMEGKLDLLLTDVMMPGPKGTVLADLLQERIPGLPVLFTSGRVGEAETSALRLGPNRLFIPKPFTLVELVASVRTAIEAGDPAARQALPGEAGNTGEAGQAG